MTNHIPVCKNTTGNSGQDAEEESPASEGKTETVGKPTGKAPDTQNVRDITETVMEERVVEEIPPNTWEQVPQCLSTERHEMTGESRNQKVLNALNIRLRKPSNTGRCKKRRQQ